MTFEREIWSLRSRQGRPGSAPAAIVELRRQSASLGLQMIERYFERRRRPRGRVVTCLSGEDAFNLYRHLHLRRVAVFVLDDGVVLNDPDRRPDEDGVVPLRRFVRYKAYFARIDVGNVAHHLEAFLRWSAVPGCGSERDARVLPLHLFDHETDWADLDTPEGIRRFEMMRGRSSQRHDCRGLPWRVDLARHGGREREQVAGLELSRGLHWDVENGAVKSRIPTPLGAYEMRPRAHVNVAPNGSVRAGAGVRHRRIRSQPDG